MNAFSCHVSAIAHAYGCAIVERGNDKIPSFKNFLGKDRSDSINNRSFQLLAEKCFFLI